MLKHRPTEPFWVVSAEEPVLKTLDIEEVRQYLITRDIDKLSLDMDSKTINGEPVTLFKCLPLSRRAARVLESNPSTGVDYLVQTHVTEVINFDGVTCVQQKDGTFQISDESMKLLDDSIINELATVIMEQGRGKDGETRAFTLPGTWREDQIRSRQLPAVNALADVVTERELMLHHQDPATTQQKPPSDSPQDS